MAKHNEIIKAGWARSPIQYWGHHWERYKINNVDFDKFWNEQGGKCPGCKQQLAYPLKRPFKDDPPGLECDVDHEHRRDAGGKLIPCRKEDVRGVLCQRCNSLLGKLRDDIELLRGLLEYLRRHGEKI